MTRLGEGLDGVRPARAGADGADDRRDRGDGERGAASRAPTRSPRSAPPGFAPRPTAPSSSTPSPSAAALEIEVIPGEEEARLAYLAATAGLGTVDGSLVVFETGGGSSQFTFGARRPRSTSGSAWRSARCASRSASASTDAVDEDGLAEALDAIAADLRGTRRPADARRARRDGRRRDEPRGREARARDVRPGRRPGHGARRSRSSIG